MTKSQRTRLRNALRAVYRLHAKSTGRDKATLWRIAQHLVMVLESDQ